MIKLPLTIPAQVKAPSKALLKNLRRAIIPKLDSSEYLRHFLIKDFNCISVKKHHYYSFRKIEGLLFTLILILKIRCNPL